MPCSERYVLVRFAIRGRDLQSAVDASKGVVSREVKLPEGVHLEWAGEYGELRQADRRPMIVVPFALLLIAGVLYGCYDLAYRHFRDHGAVPVA